MKQNKIKYFLNLTFLNLIFLIMLFFLCYFTFSNKTQNVLKASDDVFYCGDETKNNVSLMFNVYQGEEYIDDILTTLEKHDVKATFFVGGVWVSKHPETVLKIYEKGHEIANHGFYHKDHDKLNAKQNEEEIINNHKLVKELGGCEMNLLT